MKRKRNFMLLTTLAFTIIAIIVVSCKKECHTVSDQWACIKKCENFVKIYKFSYDPSTNECCCN